MVGDEFFAVGDAGVELVTVFGVRDEVVVFGGIGTDVGVATDLKIVVQIVIAVAYTLNCSKLSSTYFISLLIMKAK